jgi:hypothetical protein
MEVGQRAHSRGSDGRVHAIVHVHGLVNVLLRFLSFGDNVRLLLHALGDHVLWLWWWWHAFDGHVLLLLRVLVVHWLWHSLALAGHVLWMHLHVEDLSVFMRLTRGSWDVFDERIGEVQRPVKQPRCSWRARVEKRPVGAVLCLLVHVLTRWDSPGHVQQMVIGGPAKRHGDGCSSLSGLPGCTWRPAFERPEGCWLR